MKLLLSSADKNILKISLNSRIQSSYTNSLVVKDIFIMNREKMVSTWPNAPAMIVSLSPGLLLLVSSGGNVSNGADYICLYPFFFSSFSSLDISFVIGSISM